ncbi:MAG: exodeoxyribonuclease VII large subunit [Arenicellales bacterium]
MREFPAATPSDRPRREVFSVSALNRRLKDLLESGFPQVWVEGEISNLSRPGSGHVYFSLKDDRGQIRCALFRGRGQYVNVDLIDGARVLVRARLTLYELRGDVQLVVQHVEDAGEGALRRAFEALKRRLRDEGLFDERHKQQIPVLPARVGIITSPTGAAVRDILATFRRRFPAIPLLIHPVSVQGFKAVDEICEALRIASGRRECDVLILARGGGSLEDLQAFNDERVARAVFQCTVPVVCGVGHETDLTICDFVADRRAPTPTAAAELVSPNAQEWLQNVSQMGARLATLVSRRLEQMSQHVDWLSRLITHPRRQLRARGDRLQASFNALTGAMRSELQAHRLHAMSVSNRLIHDNPGARAASLSHRVALLEERARQRIRLGQTTRRQRLEHAVSRLNGLSPLAVLGRGYAVVTDPRSRKLIKSVDQTAVEGDVDVRLLDGSLGCVVKSKRPND